MDSFPKDFIWNQVLIPTVNQVYDCVDTELKNRYSLSKVTNSRGKRKKIESYYEEARDVIKKYFFDAGKNGENLIDMHKIAAAYTYALVKEPCFTFDDSQINQGHEITLINYELAFAFSTHLVYVNMLSDYKKDMSEKYEKLYNQGRLYFPETTKGHDTYDIGRIKALALNDKHGLDFDFLAYADMLYWIELYNKCRIERK